MDTIDKSIALGIQQGVSEFYSKLNFKTVEIIDDLPGMTACEVYKLWSDHMWSIYREIFDREGDKLK